VFRPNGWSALTDVTFQRIYRLYEDTTQIRLVFANWANQGPFPEYSYGQFTIKVGVVWDYSNGAGTGVAVPVTFSGVRSVTLEQHQVIVSDPIDVSYSTLAGSYFVVRSYVTQSGTNLPIHNAERQTPNSWNEGYLSGDYADSAANSYGGATAGVNFGPIAICGDTASGRNRSVFMTGDSILAGTGWENLRPGATGFGAYALQQAQVPGLSVACSGEALATMMTYDLAKRRMSLSHGCKYALCQYGANDIGASVTTAALKANLLLYWGYLTRRGMSVWQTTIIPRNSSTDWFQTVGNQTMFGGAGQETVRQQINQWLRAPASAGAGNSARADAGTNLAGVFDVAAQLEVNANGTLTTINSTTGAISNGAGGYTYCEATAYVTSTATSIPNAQKLADTTQTWTTNQWIGYAMVITADAGTPAAVGQVRIIAANTVDTLTSDTAWSTTPSATASYKIVKVFTTDGVHPSGFGHIRMASAIDTAQFVAR
jgi:lysophospholipase L1-like esterase